MDKQRQEEVIKALKSKSATQPCPRCRNQVFEIVGETAIPLTSEEPGPLTGRYPAMPVVLVACNNCGYITHHAQGLLGLTERP